MPTPPSPAAPPRALSEPSRTLAVRRLEVLPAWGEPTTPFRHTWEGIVNIDQFRWMARRDVQDQLALAQRELHARHVRAIGMYDDEMRVFCRSPGAFMGLEPGTPRSNWQVVDYVIDSLLDRGLNPMYTTSFMPGALARGPTSVFSTPSRTSPPSDWAAWERLVRDGVAHAVSRYGLGTVRSWKFEVWNEPNLSGWFWGGDQSDFFELWSRTFRAIKSVDASLQVGGPSCGRAAWIEELMHHGAQHDCRPDYLIAHIYNNDSPTEGPQAPFDSTAPAGDHSSPDFAIEVMRDVRSRIDRAGFKGELHWNEWGRSYHGVDFRREEPGEVAFIVRLLSAVSQEADVFSYWCLSDVYDQVGYGREAFHGGYGLFNLQGLRKPTYHAFQLLSRLGHERVAVSGTGLDTLHHAIVTAPENGRAQVLVYAYDHASQPGREPLEVTVALPPRARPIGLHRIDRHENNVVQAWRDLGAPAYLSRAQTAALAAENHLRASRTPVRHEVDGARHLAHFTMERPGVALLEIETEAE